MEEWVEAAEESCRRPRIAESRRLFKQKELDSAAIPANVLDKPESIAEIFSQVQECPSEFHKPAFAAVAGALTKGFDDAQAIVLSYTGAADELSRIKELSKNSEWVSRLAACMAAANPSTAGRIVEEAIKVCHLSDIAVKHGVRLPEFLSLGGALVVLERFAKAAESHNKVVLSNGLSDDERMTVAGMTPEDATESLERASAALLSQKIKLHENIMTLTSELELIGGNGVGEPTTISEMRDVIDSLTKELSGKRRKLESSLGKKVYKVVRSLSGGSIPSLEKVSHEELGAAIRKAAECGYEIRLEPPREN